MRRKVSIVGSGESGTGAALLAKQQGYEVFVSDKGLIAPGFAAELDAVSIPWEQGQHSLRRLLESDLVIKSPGISEKTPLIQEIITKGIPVIGEIEFAFQHLHKGKIVAVTGTNGKTTTTLLIHHLMQSAGISVALGGNVGTSLARLMVQGKPVDWYVLEMSSFQIDDCRTFRPDIALLLNITPDHLDRYDYQIERYADAKFRLGNNQQMGDWFIYGEESEWVHNRLSSYRGKGNRLPFGFNQNLPVTYSDDSLVLRIMGKTQTISLAKATLKGLHNRRNMAAACAAASLAGVPENELVKGLASFVNARHRLEPAGEVDGVRYLNDSKATNTDAAWFALDAMDQPVVWIAGGVDKGNDYAGLTDLVTRKNVHTLICLGTDNAKLKQVFTGVIPVVLEAHSMAEAVSLCHAHARPGDVVLLSPCCASFDLFRNYEDRGRQFCEAVAALSTKPQANA